MTTRAPAGGGRAWTLPPALPHTVFVGNFGSGKTEIALNYAIALAGTGERVELLDLDIVNPYFRSREARTYAASHNVHVVAPVEEYELADLPILLREVAGSIGSGKGKVVLDVGGDDLGARVLGGFTESLARAAVLQVVNERRPFTDSIEGCRRMYEELEGASRLKITGLVANAHLMEETTPEVIESGVTFTRNMGTEVGVPLEFVAVEQSLVGSMNEDRLGCPILAIERLMTAPWEKSTQRGPIGRPSPASLPTGVK